MNQEKNFVKLEVIIGLFTIEDGDVKILLEKKKDEPYKNYWMLPSNMIDNSMVLEACADEVIKTRVGLEELFLEQSNVYSDLDRVPNDRVIGVSYMATVDNVTYKLKKNINKDYELNWFSIDSIPKMAFDHDDVLKDLIELLKKNMASSTFLNKIFALEFTLPELQSVYEQINKKKVDRRNFRKKILSSDTVELTGNKMEGLMGRPANLYRFKSEKNIF